MFLKKSHLKNRLKAVRMLEHLEITKKKTRNIDNKIDSEKKIGTKPE